MGMFNQTQSQRFEAQEREIKLISKKAYGKRKGIQKKKLLDTSMR